MKRKQTCEQEEKSAAVTFKDMVLQFTCADQHDVHLMVLSCEHAHNFEPVITSQSEAAKHKEDTVPFAIDINCTQLSTTIRHVSNIYPWSDKHAQLWDNFDVLMEPMLHMIQKCFTHVQEVFKKFASSVSFNFLVRADASITDAAIVADRLKCVDMLFDCLKPEDAFVMVKNFASERMEKVSLIPSLKQKDTPAALRRAILNFEDRFNVCFPGYFPLTQQERKTIMQGFRISSLWDPDFNCKYVTLDLSVDTAGVRPMKSTGAVPKNSVMQSATRVIFVRAPEKEFLNSWKTILSWFRKDVIIATGPSYLNEGDKAVADSKLVFRAGVCENLLFIFVSNEHSINKQLLRVCAGGESEPFDCNYIRPRPLPLVHSARHTWNKCTIPINVLSDLFCGVPLVLFFDTDAYLFTTDKIVEIAFKLRDEPSGVVPGEELFHSYSSVKCESRVEARKNCWNLLKWECQSVSIETVHKQLARPYASGMVTFNIWIKVNAASILSHARYKN